ncbi:MAG TPA: class I SAM-dependent methyltransferase [Kofleriaceae bacterium]|nr:class I SAM-dependent methyltransferase [Kofleriaceae bacterium]
MTVTLVPEAIESYAQDHSDDVEPLFNELRDETFAQMSSPQMQVGRLEGRFLHLLIELTSARRVLEIGMFTGYSTLMMASALPADGELITCEIDPAAEAIARRYFGRHPDGGKIQIRMGPALDTLKRLSGPLDFVFIDADKGNYVAYYEAVLPLVRQGGLIVADNTLWSGRVLNPEAESDHAIVRFNDHVAGDSRVEKVVLTVRDGMTLARKR